MKLHKDSQGFAVHETVLIVIILGLIGFVGWYVWHTNQTTDKTLKDTSKSSTSQATPVKKIAQKEYTNDDYGFSFKYPSTWVLKNERKGEVNGVSENEISVTSPAGTVVTFYANQGGKGGDCADLEANDERSPRTCFSYDILKLESFPSGLSSRTFYYYEAKVNPPTSQGGKTYYEIGVQDNSYKTPTLGTSLSPHNLDIIGIPAGDINLSVKAGDSTSTTFLKSNQVKEAKEILKSLRLSN